MPRKGYFKVRLISWVQIYRYFLRKSKLLILDEATSAMDIETDTKITNLVKKMF